MPFPLALVAPTILGGIRGATHPTPGLTEWQSILHGAANSTVGYRALGSLWHLFNNTTGEWSDPANNPYNHPENFPSNTSNNAPAPPGMPSSGDPFDPNNPLGFKLTPPDGSSTTSAPPPSDPRQTGPDLTGSAIGPGNIPLSAWQQVYNSGRFTNAPSQFPTLAQTYMPGSAIGPISPMANPYLQFNSAGLPLSRGAAGLGTPNAVDSGMSPIAAAQMAYDLARNQV